MIKFICCFAVVALTACNGSTNSKESSNITHVNDSINSPANLATLDISGCYQLVIQKDTALMQITRTGDSVSGHLTYKRFEKDSNDGDFTGKVIPNGEVVVWYKFQSEGALSVRQSVFKIKEDALAEGYGDVSSQHDTVVFKFPTALSYEENHPFVKVACP